MTDDTFFFFMPVRVLFKQLKKCILSSVSCVRTDFTSDALFIQVRQRRTEFAFVAYPETQLISEI